MNQGIRKYLNPGEKIIWEGIPYRGFFLQPGDTFAIPFSIFFLAFVLIWNGLVWAIPAPSLFLVAGVFAIAAGLYGLIGRFFLEIYRRRRTFYALTENRILIISGIVWRSPTSISLASLKEIDLSEESKGRATITFGPLSPYPRGFTPSKRSRYTPAPAFEKIENATEVLKKIREAQTRSAEQSQTNQR